MSIAASVTTARKRIMILQGQDFPPTTKRVVEGISCKHVNLYLPLLIFVREFVICFRGALAFDIAFIIFGAARFKDLKHSRIFIKFYCRQEVFWPTSDIEGEKSKFSPLYHIHVISASQYFQLDYGMVYVTPKMRLKRDGRVFFMRVLRV